MSGQEESDSSSGSESSQGSDISRGPPKKRISSSIEEEDSNGGAISPRSDSAVNPRRIITDLVKTRWSITGVATHPTPEDFYAAVEIGDKFSLDRSMAETRALFVISDAHILNGVNASFMLKQEGKYVPIKVRFGLNQKLYQSNYKRYVLHMTISGNVATVEDKSYVAPNVNGTEAIKKHKSDQAASDLQAHVPPAVSTKKVVRKGGVAKKRANAAISARAKNVPKSPSVPKASPEPFSDMKLRLTMSQKPAPAVRGDVSADVFTTLQRRYVEEVIQGLVKDPKNIATAVERNMADPTIREEARNQLCSDPAFIEQVRTEVMRLTCLPQTDNLNDFERAVIARATSEKK